MLIDHQNIQDLKTEQVHQVLCSPWPFPLMIHLKKKTPCHWVSFSILILTVSFRFTVLYRLSSSWLNHQTNTHIQSTLQFHENSSNRWCCCDHHILLLYQLQNLYAQQSYYQKSHIHTHKFYQKKKSTFWFLFLQNHIQTDCMLHLRKCF